ncbi:MAG: ABC transporter ATP-binding protein [Rhodothalassiaceae bacterium]
MSGLRLEHLRYHYGRLAAVDDVTLTIAGGEIVCLLGPSGCGKTSCLRIVAGLAGAHGGSVRLNHRLLAGPNGFVAPEHRRIGLVQQDLALFPHMTVRQNIAFGVTKAQAGGVDALITQMGLAGRQRAYPHELSGGQQQRVALARALAPQPDAMLLDEAFSSLDVTLRRDLRGATAQILRARGTPALMVTHDPEEAFQMADRIAIMRKGRIVQMGAPAELRARPADPFVLGFFGEVNQLTGRVQDGRLSTCFGAVPAPGFDHGAEAVAHFLPDTLYESESGVSAQVSEARPAQGGWRVSLHVAGLTRPLIMVTAHARPPAPGDVVKLAARTEAWSVFPAQGAQDQSVTGVHEHELGNLADRLDRVSGRAAVRPRQDL